MAKITEFGITNHDLRANANTNKVSIKLFLDCIISLNTSECKMYPEFSIQLFCTKYLAIYNMK